MFESLAGSNLAELIDQGLRVTINSDDPAYFGGYIGDNFLAVAQAFELDEAQVVQLARNSLLGSFLSEKDKEVRLRQLSSAISSRTPS